MPRPGHAGLVPRVESGDASASVLKTGKTGKTDFSTFFIAIEDWSDYNRPRNSEVGRGSPVSLMSTHSSGMSLQPELPDLGRPPFITMFNQGVLR